ncbi:helix-turn-helix domain-containing protein [Halomonas sp. BBD45]|uniref:helix-turn-helix domain-containing protein n=2 Tax=unclassified Halomonas TaxID=2609666 RepID=UPI0034603F36
MVWLSSGNPMPSRSGPIDPGSLCHFNIPARRTILTWQRRYSAGGIDALLPRPQVRRPMKKPPKLG